MNRITTLPTRRPEAELSTTGWLIALTAVACGTLAIFGAVALAKGRPHGKIVLGTGIGLAGLVGLALLVRHSHERRVRTQAQEAVQAQNLQRAAQVRPAIIEAATQLAYAVQLKSVLRNPDLQPKADALIQSARTALQRAFELHHEYARGNPQPNYISARDQLRQHVALLQEITSVIRPEDCTQPPTPLEALRFHVDGTYTMMLRVDVEVTADQLEATMLPTLRDQR